MCVVYFFGYYWQYRRILSWLIRILLLNGCFVPIFFKQIWEFGVTGGRFSDSNWVHLLVSN